MSPFKVIFIFLNVLVDVSGVWRRGTDLEIGFRNKTTGNTVTSGTFPPPLEESTLNERVQGHQEEAKGPPTVEEDAWATCVTLGSLNIWLGKKNRITCTYECTTTRTLVTNVKYYPIQCVYFEFENVYFVNRTKQCNRAVK